MAPSLSSALLRAQTDDRLVALAASGHDRAFEAIVERYRRPLHRYLRRLLSETLAEDVVQATFFSAWSSLRAGTEIRDLRPWLYRIAHNAAINALKKVGEAMEELPESVGGLATEPATELERRDEMREALTIIAALPSRQRTALLAVAVEGRAHSDVAAELGLTDGAVRQLVHRARNTLRMAATAATPVSLLQSVLASAGDTTLQRVAEVAAGAGGAAAASMSLKAGAAAVLATGALVTGGSEVAKVVQPAETAVEPPAPQSATPVSPASGPGGGAAFATPTISAAPRAGPRAPATAGTSTTASSGPRREERQRRREHGRETGPAGPSTRAPASGTRSHPARGPAHTEDHGSTNRGPGSSGGSGSSGRGGVDNSGSGKRGGGGGGGVPEAPGGSRGEGVSGGGGGSGKGVSGSGDAPPAAPETPAPEPAAELTPAPPPNDAGDVSDTSGSRQVAAPDATAGLSNPSAPAAAPVDPLPTAPPPPAPAANGGAVRTIAGDSSGPG
jgi:RNA polymerase sigma factor (sigma-70 family)